jgi:enoyl-CoA hydratase
MAAWDFTCAAVSVESHVATVTLAATGKANRMGPEYWAQIPALFTRLDMDDDVRSVVLRGAGQHFTFGLDLAGMAGELAALISSDAGAPERKHFLDTIRQMQQSNNTVARCRKPVIAAIDGWCIGGGIDLISACDVRICTQAAKFSVREVKLAMVADLGTLARLPRIIGEGHSRELAYTGDDIDAARALRIGLVSDVYPTADALFEAARALATRIAKNSPLVVQGIKEVMNAASEPAAQQGLATVALWNAAFLPSKDLQEAITAFMEKREPRY